MKPQFVSAVYCTGLLDAVFKALTFISVSSSCMFLIIFVWKSLVKSENVFAFIWLYVPY